MVTLEGKKGLIIGSANEHSIAYGCARAMRADGVELAVTYLNEKAEPFVRPLADELDCPIIMPCDIEVPGALEGVYERTASDWGHLDFVLYSIAYAPRSDLQDRVVDCCKDGFALAMDVSVQSFIQSQICYLTRYQHECKTN